MIRTRHALNLASQRGAGHPRVYFIIMRIIILLIAKYTKDALQRWGEWPPFKCQLSWECEWRTHLVIYWE
jgi:hypothetical protein